MDAVVDASVAIKWVIGEPGEEAAIRLRGGTLTAPEILLAECGSALWAKVRRREIDEAEAHRALASLRIAPVALAPMIDLVGDALTSPLCWHIRSMTACISPSPYRRARLSSPLTGVLRLQCARILILATRSCCWTSCHSGARR